MKPGSRSHRAKLFILRGIACACSSTYCQKHHLIHERVLQNKAMNQVLTANQKLGHSPQTLQPFARAAFGCTHSVISCCPQDGWCLCHNCAAPKRLPTSPALRGREISGVLNSGYICGTHDVCAVSSCRHFDSGLILKSATRGTG